jgi:hypothetical protein
MEVGIRYGVCDKNSTTMANSTMITTTTQCSLDRLMSTSKDHGSTHSAWDSLALEPALLASHCCNTDPYK